MNSPDDPTTRRRVRTIEVDSRDEHEVARWKDGARAYVSTLEAWGKHYLRTKPFFTVAGPIDREQLAYFHDFANLVEVLGLPAGSRILDVACGPGWLSEGLYRMGYDVTGIDLCDDLLQIARERAAAVPYTPLERDPSSIRFLRMDIETEVLPEAFDAILFYDCLHHFIDVDRIFDQVAQMLVPGGKVLIKEGSMPAAGSEKERALIGEAERSQTLESPFDPAWLEQFLVARGYCLRSFVEINGLFHRNSAERDRIAAIFDAPPAMNVFLGHSAVDPSAIWRAEIQLGEVRTVPGERGQDLHLQLVVHNIGEATWRSGHGFVGAVTLGVRAKAGSETIDDQLGRTPLNQDVRPDGRASVALVYPVGGLSPCGNLSLVVDLVLEGHFWFEDRGSRPLVIEPDQFLRA